MEAAVTMEALHRNDEYRRADTLVLDVRTRLEYARWHVPGSRNIPVAEIESDAGRWRSDLEPFERVFVHCTTGARARRARDALAAAGLANLVLVHDSGMPEWIRRHHPVEREVSRMRDLATGLAAGLLAQLAVAPVDAVLRRVVSGKQKRRERRVRAGSPHEIAGTKLGERLTARTLTRTQRRRAQIAFTIGYGLVWGAVYALARRRVPRAGAFLGVPSGAIFFLVCDGAIAPLLRLGPGLPRIPWQFNGKELVNHLVWTAVAETIHRGAERLVAPGAQGRP